MFRAKFQFAALTLAAALSLSCSSKAPDDQAIVTGIQSKLYADPLTKPASVAVAAQHGVVTLSGDVHSSDVALQAMRIANGTAGVRTVNDQMTINGASAAAQLGSNPDLASAPSPAPAPAPAEPAPPNEPAAAPPSSAAPVAAVPPPSSAPPPAQPVQSAPPPPPPPPKPQFVVFAAGTQIQIRTIDAIDSKNSQAGEIYRASLNTPLVRGDRVIIAAGAPVDLRVAAAKSAGRIKGSSELAVHAVGIEYHGKKYDLNTAAIAQQGKGRGKQTTVRTGVGAAAGALIGGLAGGGKGAGIGAAVGGGAGFGSAALTHGQEVKIPSETILTFQLESSLKLPR